MATSNDGLRNGRVWTEEAHANHSALHVRLSVIRSRACPDGLIEREFHATCAGIEKLLDNAMEAIKGRSPQHRIFTSWWNGTCVEAAFKHLHKAEVEMARLYDKDEVCAEVPEAVARAEWALRQDEPRRDAARYVLRWIDSEAGFDRTQLSKIIQLGHEAADRQRTKLRVFRNIVLLGGVVGVLLGAIFIGIVSMHPKAVPFCLSAPSDRYACPTSSTGPSSGDVGTVALMGLLGGLISGAVFINGLKANSTPYNVSVPLALVKVPAGALTALAGLLILAGGFIPGFSAVNTQAQVLAYALVFGFAQQVLTRLLDQRARNLVSSIPSKGSGPYHPVGDWLGGQYRPGMADGKGGNQASVPA